MNINIFNALINYYNMTAGKSILGLNSMTSYIKKGI